MACAFLTGATVSAAAALAAEGVHPDFNGLWRCARNCGNGELIPWQTLEITEEGRARYEYNSAGVQRGDPTIDTVLACRPVGIPRLAMFGTFEIFQRDDAIGIIGEWSGPPRVIRFAEHHRDNFYPTFMGDPIAHWEGDTLVVETVNIDEQTFLDSSGFPHSDQLRFVERWTLSDDGNSILSDWTIEDPKIFNLPFTKQVEYVRKDESDETQRVAEYVCQNLEEGGRIVN
nr:MAG: hypothetical protein E4H34_00375 [Hyphomicrobiales bacterium]